MTATESTTLREVLDLVRDIKREVAALKVPTHPAMTIVQFALTQVAPGVAAAIFGAKSVTYSYNATSTIGAARVNGPLGGAGETGGFLLVAFAFGAGDEGALQACLAQDGDCLVDRHDVPRIVAVVQVSVEDRQRLRAS